MHKHLALAAAILILLAGCSHDDPIFGSSYDACVLKHEANDTAKKICERHFSCAPTKAEDETIRDSSRGTAKLMLNQEGNFVTGEKAWDKVDAQILQHDDDLVVTKAKLTATFFSDSAMTQRLKEMSLVWDGLDVDDTTGTVVALFGEDRARSPYTKTLVSHPGSTGTPSANLRSPRKPAMGRKRAAWSEPHNGRSLVYAKSPLPEESPRSAVGAYRPLEWSQPAVSSRVVASTPDCAKLRPRRATKWAQRMNWRRWFGRSGAKAAMVMEAEATAAAPSAGAAAQGSSALSADNPIDLPAQDAFGFDPFARALATSIAGLRSPEGLVIGVHGPWGSGKSSAINLVKHHLETGGLQGAEDLVLVEFNPWWFNGADALAIAFFSELGSAIGKSLPDKAKDAFRELGRKLGSASPLIEAAVNLATVGAGGAAAGGAAKFVGDVLGCGRTVQEEHAVIAKALRSADRRYLVIIDDLDRLSADDALLIFRLVKSVGRLPNVIYLVVFDRELTEASVAERFPSEGAHFLEKIVQAAFELPPPEPDDLRSLLLNNVSRIIGKIEDGRLTRFMNVFYDVVAPNIARPRDVVRLTNALEVTWPAVAGNVDAADFLAMETLRLFWPRVHRGIYDNKTLVCGHQLGFAPRAQAQTHCDTRLLGSVPEPERPQLRSALMRLFPALENAWSNHFYDAEFGQEWRLQRQVCVEAHFETYYRFAPSDTVATATEIQAFVARACDPDFVRDALCQALATTRRRSGTRAAVLLDELTFRASQVPEASIAPLVTAIFSIADELDVAADKAGAFSVGDNFLRIHWLLNRLVTERLAIGQRDAVLEAATQTATLRWLIDVTLRCIDQHEPAEDGRRRGEPLISAEAAARLRALALARVEGAAADGTLIGLPDLVPKLFRWCDLIGEGGAERVRAWLGERLDDNSLVEALARSFVSVGWSHSAGDVVARRYTHLDRGSVEALVDSDALKARMAEILTMDDVEAGRRAAIEDFNTAWERPGRGVFGD